MPKAQTTCQYFSEPQRTVHHPIERHCEDEETEIAWYHYVTHVTRIFTTFLKEKLNGVP